MYKYFHIYKFCGRQKLIELCWGWENSSCFSSGIKERRSRDQFIKAWKIVSHNFYQLNLWATQEYFYIQNTNYNYKGKLCVCVCVCVCVCARERTLNWNPSVKDGNGVTNSDLHERLLFQITYNVTGNFYFNISSPETSGICHYFFVPFLPLYFSKLKKWIKICSQFKPN